jgi:hypothetical protein
MKRISWNLRYAFRACAQAVFSQQARAVLLGKTARANFYGAPTFCFTLRPRRIFSSTRSSFDWDAAAGFLPAVGDCLRVLLSGNLRRVGRFSL